MKTSALGCADSAFILAAIVPASSIWRAISTEMPVASLNAARELVRGFLGPEPQETVTTLSSLPFANRLAVSKSPNSTAKTFFIRLPPLIESPERALDPGCHGYSRRIAGFAAASAG